MDSTVTLAFLVVFGVTVNLGAAHHPSPEDIAKAGDHVPSPAQVQEFVDCHNKYRAEVGSPPICWNESMACRAQAWADILAAQTTTDISDEPGYGENVVGGPYETPKDAVECFAKQKGEYDVENNKCRSDPMSCRQYTQMVWNESTQLGCGIGKCSNGLLIYVCDYWPMGNCPHKKPF